MSTLPKEAGGPVEVVAGILERDGRFLIAKRAKEGRLPSLWEFPGGKVEAGESHPEALEREFMEELGVTIRVGGPIASTVHCYPDGTIRLSGFRIYHQEGDFELRVHQELQWVPLAELRAWRLAPADLPIVEALEGSTS